MSYEYESTAASSSLWRIATWYDADNIEQCLIWLHLYLIFSQHIIMLLFKKFKIHIFQKFNKDSCNKQRGKY